MEENNIEIEEIVLFEVKDNIAIISLNRPKQRNAINRELSHTVAKYINQIENDKNIRVAIIRSTTPQAFSAGADLGEISQGLGYKIPVEDGGLCGLINKKRKKPFIAAVNGFAFGGGMEIALACDLIIAGKGAKFGLPEVKRGLLAGAGGMFRIPKYVPRNLAIELLITGEGISADRAAQIGLVNRVVEDDALFDEAIKFAEQIANNAPLAVQESLQFAKIAFDHNEDECFEISKGLSAKIGATNDAKEGSKAFVEKRAPNWTAT